VQATQKITRAMELIAASQIARAQARIAANHPYRAGLQRAVAEVLAESSPDGDDATAGALQTAAVIVIAGDRGLSGAYNSSVLRATERLLDEQRAAGIESMLVTVGRKARSYFRFRGRPLARFFEGMADRPSFSDARTVAAVVWDAFAAGEVQQVSVVSTRFFSAGRQAVEVRQLLPLRGSSDATGSGMRDRPAHLERTDVGAGGGEAARPTQTELVAAPPATPGATGGAPAARLGYTEFEPDSAQLLATLAPQVLESELFSAMLEASASEHAARQRAMAAATENADELIRTLSRIMNRARQDAITTEIMEIVGGAEALRAARRT